MVAYQVISISLSVFGLVSYVAFEWHKAKQTKK